MPPRSVAAVPAGGPPRARSAGPDPRRCGQRPCRRRTDAIMRGCGASRPPCRRSRLKRWGRNGDATPSDARPGSLDACLSLGSSGLARPFDGLHARLTEFPRPRIGGEASRHLPTVPPRPHLHVAGGTASDRWAGHSIRSFIRTLQRPRGGLMNSTPASSKARWIADRLAMVVVFFPPSKDLTVAVEQSAHLARSR